MSITQKEIEHVFERLRSGAVPERGLEAFAVGTEAPRQELRRILKMSAEGEGTFKFLRGGYGCGKTFMARLLLQDALAEGFVTSFVVVSTNDLRFHRFDELYRKVIQALATPYCASGALMDLLDRWVGKVEDALISGGADEDAADFDDQVQARLKDDLLLHTRGEVPNEMIQALLTVFQLKQKGELAEARRVVSWLEGGDHLAAPLRNKLGLKGQIESDEAMRYLRGVLEIIKAAGFKGLVIVVDELETILRDRSDTRAKSLNGLRQIIDAASSMPGICWVFTGTPDFFDDYKGVASLQPLHDRIRIERVGAIAPLRGPQLELKQFDQQRLKDVTLKLRALYPARDPERFQQTLTESFLADLIQHYAKGYDGQVQAIPRQFLKKLAAVMDAVDDTPDLNLYRDVLGEPVKIPPEEIDALKGAPDPDDHFKLVDY